MKNLSNLLNVFLFLSVFFISSEIAQAQCSSSRSSHWSSRRSNQNTNLVNYAANQSNLSTLVAAVKAAGLVETLAEGGPFTIFAPSNDAFAALPKGTVEDLLRPGNKDKLIKILSYHVVPGRIEASDLKDGQKVKSLEGSSIDIQVNGSTVGINNALVRNANQ
ncbi:MAG: fasciclin domain-containing protein, partial [Bacteroidota bacterium]